jgi:CUG-BP- and ETR3-like factor
VLEGSSEAVTTDDEKKQEEEHLTGEEQVESGSKESCDKSGTDVHENITTETIEKEEDKKESVCEEKRNDEGVTVNKVEVKLFVGRLPRSYEEASLTELFSPFGTVVETVIIRDKTSGQHKGSGFVKMASITDADAAIRSLHNIKIVDPQSGPILVKYANGEPERLGLSSTDSAQPGTDLGKLFVGSLGRFLSDEQVRRLFEPYGTIEEIILMKDPSTNQSRGCAFVKFTYKEHAINAIKALHGIVVTPGSSRPLEVKFAESRRTPMISQTSNRLQGTPTMSFNETPALINPTWDVTKNVPTPSNLNPRTAAGWTEYFTADNRPYYHNETTGLTQWAKPHEFDRFFIMYGVTRPPMMTTRCGGLLVPPTNNVPVTSPSVRSSQHADVAGPPGANVFVFHIPNEWTQNDVAAHFSPFGMVISCYIATDKTTGRNKGYGFVSFDNVHSAAKAVMGMNGYLVGSKRLKVSIKIGEERYVAHLLGPNVGNLMTTTTTTTATPTSTTTPHHHSNPHTVPNQHASHILEPISPLRNYSQENGYHHHLNTHTNYPSFMPPTTTNGLGAHRAAPY